MDSEFTELSASGRSFCFIQAKLQFFAHGLSNLFAQKNNKSLQETLEHPRYNKFAEVAHKRYSGFLNLPLGSFLSELKLQGDPFYRRFLNRHGDEVYCTFRMADSPLKAQAGLYLYSHNNEVMYIGRSRDPFGKRVDQGYGKIHPKNCYIDGQSTNCHLNSLIESRSDRIKYFVYPMTSIPDIEACEKILIQNNRPEWNVALA